MTARNGIEKTKSTKFGRKWLIAFNFAELGPSETPRLILNKAIVKMKKCYFQQKCILLII